MRTIYMYLRSRGRRVLYDGVSPPWGTRMAFDRIDEVAADLDDLATDVEELGVEVRGSDADQLEKVKRALEDAKDAIGVLDTDEEQSNRR